MVFSCKYPVVWCSEYRRNVLANGADDRLREIVRQVCLETNSEEPEVLPDQVHLLACVDPQVGIHRLVKLVSLIKPIKGRSSGCCARRSAGVAHGFRVSGPTAILFPPWAGLRWRSSSSPSSSMSKNATPSFVLELPLSVDGRDEHLLSARFEAARQLYNAVLGEALRRMSLMKESCEWQKGRDLPSKTRERSRAFAECARVFGFTDYDLQAYGTRCKNSCRIGEHLDAHATQTTATRAFRAAERYLFRSSGRPRFRTKRQGLSSVEGKSTATGTRWRTDRVEWSELILAPRFASPVRPEGQARGPEPGPPVSSQVRPSRAAECEGADPVVCPARLFRDSEVEGGPCPGQREGGARPRPVDRGGGG